MAFPSRTVPATAACLLLAILSGCATAATKAEEEPVPTPIEHEAESFLANLTAAGSVDVLVTQVNAVSRDSFQNNCFTFERSDVRLARTLNVTATWNAEAPTQEELELRVYGDQETIVQGRSPLSLVLEDVKPDGFFEGILVMLQAPSPAGVTLSQPATVAYEMTYDGQPELTTPAGGCAFS